MRFEVTFRNARIYALRGDFQWLDNSALLRANDREDRSSALFSMFKFSVALIALLAPALAADWSKQAELDAAQDRKVVIFEGASPNKLACDTMVRKMPDGTWLFIMLGGGDKEPLPENHILSSRTTPDEGNTWSPLVPLDLKLPPTDRRRALVPSEVMVYKGNSTLRFATHDGSFGEWTSWYATSSDSGRTWGPAQPLPGELHHSTFVRNHIVSRAGDIILPFQHYVAGKGPVDPRNGVLIALQMVVGRSGATGRSVYLMTTNTVAGPRML